jgi:hypothetical protein
MNSSQNNQWTVVDDDDDNDLEYLFGFRAKQVHTETTGSNNKNIAATVVEDSTTLSTSSKGRVNFDSWKEKMDENIRKNNDNDGIKFIEIDKITMEPAVKLIRLDEITDAEVDDMEAELFQKYTANEYVRDDSDNELDGTKDNSNKKEIVEGVEEDEEEKNYYELYDTDEEEEEGTL